MSSLPELRLKPEREKSLLRRHPWVFSGAVAAVVGDPQPGDTVDVRAADGTWLARAAYSPRSQIVARVWSFQPADEIDAAFIHARMTRAVALRTGAPGLQPAVTDALRWVNAESDGLPGLVVDRYGRWLVVQALSAGAERWKAASVAALQALAPDCAGVYERSDVDVREKEGLAAATGVLAGEAPPELVEVGEHGARFRVDVRRGHKTGFYLDQRDNRALVAAHAAGREVLNCFAYTGAFGVQALLAGAAHVTQIEASGAALALAQEHLALNGLDAARSTAVEGDVFAQLRRYRDARRQFDLIVLDPPKFAESKHHVERAARGYKDINLLAFKLLRPGGRLFTFSCSGAIDSALFQKIVADAALDAGRDAQIVRRLGQAPDHPVGLAFPEGEYLKGLVCQAA